MPKNEPWNEDEVDKAVQTYFKMLRRELEGDDYTKAAYQKEVAKNTSRSAGAARLKFQQISTVLDDRGFRHIDGYSPRENYQQNLLEERIEEELDENPDLKSELRRPQNVDREEGHRDESSGKVQSREQEPFQLTSERSDKSHPQRARPKQKSFEDKVFERYGEKCAVCEIDVGEMLVAAHIRGKAESGSDDARNGLVLCKNHHAAFDEGLFSVEPETHLIHTREKGPSKQELRIEYSRLSPARNKPHEKAVRWHWERWKEEQ